MIEPGPLSGHERGVLSACADLVGSRALSAVAMIEDLPRDAARMLAVEILLAEPESLGDDVLESCPYVLQEKLRAVS
jgi:hypothetical protein